MRTPPLAAVSVAVSAVMSAVLALLPAGASAQSGLAGPIECSRFLHNRDGSWSSFWQGDVFGSDGPVSIHPGERFARGADRRRADVAAILDHICRD